MPISCTTMVSFNISYLRYTKEKRQKPSAWHPSTRIIKERISFNVEIRTSFQHYNLIPTGNGATSAGIYLLYTKNDVRQDTMYIISSPICFMTTSHYQKYGHRHNPNSSPKVSYRRILLQFARLHCIVPHHLRATPTILRKSQ